MTTYLTDSEGKFIPATQRPDGTWRKARRVKDGYVPQEEVPLYESKGKKISERRNNMQHPPGYSPNGVDILKKEREDLMRAKKAVAANLLNARVATALTNDTVVSAGGKKNITKSNNKGVNKTNTSNDNLDELCSNLCATSLEVTEQQHIAKQLKKLRKKLREIETIEEKLDSGELKKPEVDQLIKVKRKAEIMHEIERLTIEDLRLASNLMSGTEAATTNSVPPPINTTRR